MHPMALMNEPQYFLWTRLLKISMRLHSMFTMFSVPFQKYLDFKDICKIIIQHGIYRLNTCVSYVFTIVPGEMQGF